jgi:3'-phosphoadenosine 5'-phosphosulfate sulfotransferase (PAPS reductase)/FAD synthetase
MPQEEKKVKHIVCFSGGKDSTALILWAKENLEDFTPVICETEWEHPINDAYVEEINQTVLGGRLVRLRSKRYPKGFVQLVTERHMVPGAKSRFCTDELKVFPLHDYYAAQDDEVTSYQGVRADESAKRSKMPLVEWVNEGGGYWLNRPLLNWTAEQCFAKMAEHGVKPNPLYLQGATRVGCWPCIMTGLGELKRAVQFFPELKQRVIDMEKAASDGAGEDKFWFRSDKIPDRFKSASVVTKDGRTVLMPTAEDVFRYIESVDEDQLPMFPARSCMSVYNLCE